MSARDDILKRIRDARRPELKSEVPAVPEIYPRLSPDSETLKTRYEKELTALSGTCFLLKSMDEAREKLGELIAENDWNTFSSDAGGEPFLREVFPGGRWDSIYFGEPGGETDKNRLASIPVSFVFPQLLVADTGTAVVCNRSAHARLNCYLTPACVMFARASQLREHLPAAWSEIAKNVRNSELRGEYVFVTGPSRTADIERVTILGVHGPKKVITLIVD